MQPAEWRRFIAQFAQLNRRQRQAGIALLCGNGPHDVTVTLLENATQARLGCPACQSCHLHRHGHAHGLQRYRCVSCGRTFNALTGTPLAHLRHKSLWLDYADCLLDSRSVRQAAQQLGLHRNTTFRWRHRFLSVAKTDRPHCLHGIAEADELYVLESEKGSRQMTRPARRRGGHAHQRGISNEQVCILVARDRTGQTLDFVTGKGGVDEGTAASFAVTRYRQGRAAGDRRSCRLSGFCEGSGHQPPSSQLARWHPCARGRPRAERQCLSQPLARMATALSRRGDALPAELPGLALDTRRQAHPFIGNVIESNVGRIPTLDGDIAKKDVRVYASVPN